MTFAVAALVVLTAPAQAGSGNAAGTFVINDAEGVQQSPPCAANYETVMTVKDQGTFTSGSATYQGPADVEITTAGTFYEGPSGTHGSDDTCSSSTLGTAVDVDTEGPNGSFNGGSIACDPDTGTLVRDTDTFEITWTPSCSINGGSTVTLTMTQTGILSPGCGPITMRRAYACAYVGSYSQS